MDGRAAQREQRHGAGASVREPLRQGASEEPLAGHRLVDRAQPLEGEVAQAGLDRVADHQRAGEHRGGHRRAGDHRQVDRPEVDQAATHRPSSSA